MDDRTLLEKAAKAAGYVTPFMVPDHKGKFCIVTDDGWQEWNPLLDDGDALRLAVKLEIELYVSSDDGSIGSYAGWVKEWTGGVQYCIERHENSDPYAATRRCIVRAAASLGDARPCAGANCGTRTGQHSAECIAEHARACAPRAKD